MVITGKTNSPYRHMGSGHVTISTFHSSYSMFYYVAIKYIHGHSLPFM